MTIEYGQRVFIQGCGTEGTADLHKFRIVEGCELVHKFLDKAEQAELLNDVQAVIAKAPLYQPHMPRTGKPFSVMMTNCGPLGWVSDKTGGYRYESIHPQTKKTWPDIPARLVEMWNVLTGFGHPPQACLVNYYNGSARLGMHRDEDESDFSAPILSVSLGDSAIFKLGGLKRRDPAHTLELKSGDVLVMGGASRLRYHGISRIVGGSSDLLPEGGRINLTMRYIGA